MQPLHNTYQVVHHSHRRDSVQCGTCAWRITDRSNGGLCVSYGSLSVHGDRREGSASIHSTVCRSCREEQLRVTGGRCLTGGSFRSAWPFQPLFGGTAGFGATSPFGRAPAKDRSPLHPVVHFRRAKGRFAIRRSYSWSEADQPLRVDVGFGSKWCALLKSWGRHSHDRN